MENINSSLKGQFLMAMPGLADPNFAQTVACMCEHTQDGSVGLVINRVHDSLNARDIFDELKIKYIPEKALLPIYIGGPVHLGEIFILHSLPFHWKGCLMVTPFLAMSNTIDILQAIAQGRGPTSFLIALGCAGWGPNQLEAELKENVWLTTPISEEIIFRTSIESRWEESVKQLGINPVWLSETAGHA